MPPRTTTHTSTSTSRRADFGGTDPNPWEPPGPTELPAPGPLPHFWGQTPNPSIRRGGVAIGLSGVGRFLEGQVPDSHARARARARARNRSRRRARPRYFAATSYSSACC